MEDKHQSTSTQSISRSPNSSKTKRKKAKASGPIQWFAAHQIEVSSAPLAVILLANLFEGPPTFSLKSLHPLHFPPLDPTYHVETIPARFLFLSYRDPVTGLCLKGADDFLVVVFWVLVWTFTRETSMRYFFAPLGRVWGIKKDSILKRFSEQGWGMLYASLSFTFGLNILSHAPYRSRTFLMLPTIDFFTGYPHFSLTPATKFYYLVQIAFWVQTLIALNIEKRRKDFWQMFAHHVITIGLIVGSYATNFTRVGCLILVQMDPVDIALPVRHSLLLQFLPSANKWESYLSNTYAKTLQLAKMSKYLGFTLLPDVLFGIFLFTWIMTRHVFYTMTVYYVIARIPMAIDFEWNPSAGKFLSTTSYTAFLLLLVGLQVILYLWLVSILRVVVRVVTSQGADDVRSDSEDETEAELQIEEDRVAQKANQVIANGTLGNSTLRRRQKG